MVIYVGASLYHILCFSVHKLIHHPKEDAILVIGDNIFSKSGMKELKEDLEHAAIFQRVEVLKFIEGAYKNPVKLTEESSREDVKSFIKENEKWVENWLGARDINLENMSKIYSAIDHRHLGMYILSKEFPYEYFEDGNGLLSRENVQLEFHLNAQYESYAVSKFLGALGNNKYVTKKHANMMAQVEGFEDPLASDFQVIQLFGTLKEEEKERIFQMFHMEEVIDTNGEKPVLYLTRYVQYMQRPSMNMHHFMATILLDLFAGKAPVLIKSHPRDFTGRYQDIFPKAKVLAKQFPSELLPFVTKTKFQKVITVGSTAIDALTQASEEVIKLDAPFEGVLYQLYHYIAMALVLQQLEIDGAIGYKGEVGEFVLPLLKEVLGVKAEEAMEGKEYQVLWMDEETEGNWKADCYCYTSTKYMKLLSELEAVFLTISSKKVRKNAHGNDEYGVLSFETKRPKVIEQLNQIKICKEFSYTGSELDIAHKTKEEQMYMRVCLEMKKKYPFLDLPMLEKNIKQEHIEAMIKLRDLIEMRGI